MLLAAAWLSICWRAYLLQVARTHRCSITRLTLDCDGGCVIDFADGLREQRAALTGRVTTASWVLLRLHAPARNATLLLTPTCMPPELWHGLQVRLRWIRHQA